ncbi:hypothetical protein AMTRI_Chr09g43160 [Amborella trichopoda]
MRLFLGGGILVLLLEVEDADTSCTFSTGFVFISPNKPPVLLITSFRVSSLGIS